MNLLKYTFLHYNEYIYIYKVLNTFCYKKETFWYVINARLKLSF